MSDYGPQWHANYIATSSLNEIRWSSQEAYPMYGHDQWLKGRCSAVASLFPSVETISADNEAQFLVRYNSRHGVYKS